MSARGLRAAVALVLMTVMLAGYAPRVWSQAQGVDEASQILVLLSLPPQHFRPDANYAGSYSDSSGRVARRRVALQLAREHGLTMAGDWPMPLLGLDCYVMSVPPDRSADRITQELSRDTRVSWVQRMNVYQAQGHDDPLFALQPARAEWQLAALHESVQGRRMRVAVIDSAVERQHPDLVDRIDAAEDFMAAHPGTAENHGTAVAGIIAATGDNGLGMVGVAPQARLLALRACWEASTEATRCNTLSLAQALHAAITRDAQVINLSLSGPPDRLLGMLVDTALERGIAVVAAVDRAAPGGGFPAMHRGVIAVDDAGRVLRGAAVVVSAPGRDVPTTVTGRRWALVSGTSYAAAHVSGLLALLGEARERRGWTGESKRALDARDLVLLPDGRIDACASLGRIARNCSCACTAAGVAPTVARQ